MGKVRYILTFLAILMHLSWWISAVAQQEQCKTNSGGKNVQKSNIGKTFYLATMVNYRSDDPVALKIVTNTTGYVNIVAPGLGFNHTYTVTPDVTEISLNHSVRSNKLGIGNSGVILMSTVDIAVFVLENSQTFGISEGYTLISVDDSFTSFVVHSYEPRNGSRSQFIIQATDDFTNINISLRMAGQLSYSQVQYLDEDTLSVNLNRLQTFHLYHAHDLTGSIIESSRPIVVFSGTDCVDIPQNAKFCDMIETELIPVHHLDMAYIVPPTYPNSKFLIRIAAYYNQTTFYLNSSKNISRVLNRGQYFDTFLTTAPVVIESDKKISAAMFDSYNTANNNLGSPFMIAVPGVSQFASSPYVFPTKMQRQDKKPYTNYVSIIIKKQFRDEIKYDGSLLSVLLEYSVPSPYNQYVVIVVKLKNQTTHTISTNNTSAPMGVFVYGTARDEGYGFVAGIHFDDLVPDKNCTDSTITSTRVVTSPTTMRTVSNNHTTVSPASPDTQLSMRCFSCKNMEHLRYCDTLQYCQRHEVCYISRERTGDGQIIFSAGCTKQQFCSSRTRRLLIDTDRCMECCHSDFCNNNGCGDNGFPSADHRGPLCFDCEHYNHPLSCHHVALCGRNEQCSIEGHRWGENEVVHKMGCMVSYSCPRDLEEESLKVYRSTPFCHTCCSTDFCNVNCTQSRVNAPIIG